MEITQNDMNYLREKIETLLQDHLQLQCVLEKYIAQRENPSVCYDPIFLRIIENLQKPISENLYNIRILLDNIEVNQHL